MQVQEAQTAEQQRQTLRAAVGAVIRICNEHGVPASTALNGRRSRKPPVNAARRELTAELINTVGITEAQACAIFNVKPKTVRTAARPPDLPRELRRVENFGERNSQAVMTEATARTILREAAEAGYPDMHFQKRREMQTRLREQYGITKGALSCLLIGRTWRHLPRAWPSKYYDAAEQAEFLKRQEAAGGKAMQLPASMRGANLKTMGRPAKKPPESKPPAEKIKAIAETGEPAAPKPAVPKPAAFIPPFLTSKWSAAAEPEEGKSDAGAA